MRIGLALSGGGFRATLYHLGVVRFLRDAGLLEYVSHVTCVSGGSVLGAHLVMNWDRYCGEAEQFDEAAQEILDFVSLDVRNRILRRYPWLVAAAVWRRLLLRRSSRLLTRTGLLERYYQRHLFGDVCLHQLPSSPELHVLCTNVSEGGLTSFTREGLLIQRRMADGSLVVKRHRAGLAKVATAVAASSAFPAFFPPLELRADDIGASEGEFPTQYFTDGGIFDNLGVRMFHYLGVELDARPREGGGQPPEGACDVILASDVGRVFSVYGPERTPGFLSTALRSSDILMNRVWQLERTNFDHARQCVFLASSDTVSRESDPAALHPEIQIQVSRLRTDMDRFREIEISGLIRHGYCVARHACHTLPSPLSDNLGEHAPWDPTARASGNETNGSDAPDASRFENVALAARALQRGTRTRLLNALLDPRDWITWIYVPLLVLLFVLLPLFGYRTYRHVRLNAALTRAVAETREDFGKMLELLEFGPPETFESMEFTQVDTLAPRLAEEGLDIISDNRITDLREWLGRSAGETRRVYVYRHVLVRKNAEADNTPGLRLQSLWDSPDLSIHCENTGLKPVLQRVGRSSRDDPDGPCRWGVALDFSSVPIGETVEVIVNIMQTAPPDDSRYAEREWWRFEVDANPEIATSWILLPSDMADANFNVVRSRNETPEVVELVKPTHQTKMYGGSAMNWSVVHPEPTFTYSTRWSWE